MNPSINRIRASDGSANASLATVQSSRAPLATTIDVDTVAGIPDEFFGSMGTPHTFTDPITSETITVISEATAVDFAGHVDGANLEIDEISPGYTDLGSEIGDIIIIRPVTAYADNVADVLDVSHDDDGTMKKAAIVEGLDTYGVLGTIRKYTSSDTWSKPAGIKFVEVEVVGGGGSGGGVAAGTGSNGGSPSGGGGGGYSRKRIAAASLGATETVTVGAGGAAGAAGSGNGNAGGTTSFGSHLQATGGAAGLGDAMHTHNVGGAPVQGGVGSSGDLNMRGAPSIAGYLDIANGRGNSSKGGDGGFMYGIGGEGVRLSGAGSTAGVDGNVYGGGGGGGIAVGSGAARSGGAGAAGIVIVREYF